MKKAMFAAGCFWGVEETFRQIKGVRETAVGYSSGITENPAYEQVCSGATGHAEVVEVSFDSDEVPYESLLEAFWSMHDPTTLNRQGPDVGAQYRSGIYYYDESQRLAAETSKAALEASGRHSRPVVSEIMPAQRFYRAEEYHQRYLEKSGMGSCHVPGR